MPILGAVVLLGPTYGRQPCHRAAAVTSEEVHHEGTQAAVGALHVSYSFSRTIGKDVFLAANDRVPVAINHHSLRAPAVYLLQASSETAGS